MSSSGSPNHQIERRIAEQGEGKRRERCHDSHSRTKRQHRRGSPQIDFLTSTTLTELSLPPPPPPLSPSCHYRHHHHHHHHHHSAPHIRCVVCVLCTVAVRTAPPSEPESCLITPALVPSPFTASGYRFRTQPIAPALISDPCSGVPVHPWALASSRRN